MTFKKYITFFVLLLATILGCQEGSSPISEENPVAQPLLAEYTAHMLTPSAFSGKGLEKAERTFIAKHSVEDQRRISEILQQSPTWDEAHHAVQDLLAQKSELPSYIREQRAAVFMLKSARSIDVLTDFQRENMGLYLNMLAEYRSPEAALILESLRKLDGFWPEEKIQYVASRATEGADLYLKMKYYCAECPAGKAAILSHKPVEYTQDVFIQELLGSVEALRLLSDSPRGG